MNLTDEINRRKERWNELYSNDGKIRRLILIEAGDYYPERPPLWRSKKQERLDWIMKKYELQLKAMEFLQDDRIPYLDMLSGTEILAESFGCEVKYPENDTPFALPTVSNAAQAASLKKPKLEDTPLMFLFEMADELQARAGKNAVFRLPDVQSPMDAAAQIWDKNDFYIALIEEPEAVKYVSGMARELLSEFMDEWFSRYGCEFIGSYPDYYMPKGLHVSVDEIGVVNESMFGDYFMPELKFLSEHFGGLGIHSCADSRHQWGNFKNVPGLRLLNLVRPAEMVKEAYKFFDNHCVQMHLPGGTGEPDTWYRQLPDGVRAVLLFYTDTMEDAKMLMESLSK